MGDTKSSFSEKVITITFFRECAPVTQNGHFFRKNIGKMFDKKYENYVLLHENTFYEKWQSGRINFFWGGFSAFMVYALTLISTRKHPFFLFLGIPQKKKEGMFARQPLAQKNLINIYRKTVKGSSFISHYVRDRMCHALCNEWALNRCLLYATFCTHKLYVMCHVFYCFLTVLYRFFIRSDPFSKKDNFMCIILLKKWQFFRELFPKIYFSRKGLLCVQRIFFSTFFIKTYTRHK